MAISDGSLAGSLFYHTFLKALHPPFRIELTEAFVSSRGFAPSLTIVLKDGTQLLQCAADAENIYNLQVNLSRELAWDAAKNSWRWHKTWRVPDCLVTADTSALYGVGDLEAHLSVVCQGEKPHQLQDAGVQSLDRSQPYASLQLVDGRCRFSRLRLVGTTSTFGGRLFHFVVSIVRRERENITAIASVISTAFAVYSRKNADKKRKVVDREAMMSGRWSEGYSFIPFDPKELDRKFIKKAVNTEGVMVEKEITNSWEGLLAYFQAPNIRFKIRHPLFLAIRFSSVLVILRDSLRFPQESEEALRSFICSCGFPLNCKRDPAVKIGHGEFLPPWLIAFRNSAMSDCSHEILQKLSDLMKVVKGPALGFVPDDSLLPQRYSPTFDVTSLGQLYSKLYAIEFASSLKDKSNGNTQSSIITKKPKTKMEPMESDTVVGYHPCGTPIYAPESSRVKSSVSHAGDSSSSSRGPSQQMRTSFESYFISLHGELRMLLQKVVELVSQCVTDPQKADKETLRKAYEDFTEALSVHAYVEEQVMFKKLSDRFPRVTESYSVDHWLEKGKMDEIANIMRDMDPQKIADLFLKISELAAVHKVHMDKEEFHLLPYFLDHFSDEEIIDLIRQSQDTFNQYIANSRKTHDRRISLMNPRHQKAIEKAMEAAGINVQSDEHAVDPPEQISDRCFNENSDEVLALIDEMYR
eukprot:TRINITY_DN22_c0_g1_i1.p2 TRINITY_DN22_c0_g1~~TRINITY_DN22_c0_g1_i1.p2  ORF type:complete len:696 (-),score=84.99 TRINITY_DN22_c0_g1_i1:7759-9846(-)